MHDIVRQFRCVLNVLTIASMLTGLLPVPLYAAPSSTTLAGDSTANLSHTLAAWSFPQVVVAPAASQPTAERPVAPNLSREHSAFDSSAALPATPVEARMPNRVEAAQTNLLATLTDNNSRPYRAAAIAAERTVDIEPAVIPQSVQAQASSAAFWGPEPTDRPYLRREDSPFADSIGSDGFYFENFEDGDHSLNTPGVAISLNPGTWCYTPSPTCYPDLADSVDFDDGTIDGSGSTGHDLWAPASPGIIFTFDKIALGSLPTAAGVVWTDGAVGEIVFEAFDAAGNSLGQRTGSSTDPYNNGGTDEDRFYGVIYAGGISKITISQSGGGGIEVDHLQYGKVMPLDPSQTMAKGECPLCSNVDIQRFAADPINTFSGNYNYQATDFSISTANQPLRFERSYNSLPVTGTAVYSRPLGYGWTHNYDIDLTFPGDPSGEPGTVILKAPHGSRMRFSDDGSGNYTAYPGVWATMTRQGMSAPYTYVVTAANQTAYTFVDSASYPSTKLIASDGAADDRFGDERSVSIDGDTAIVGAHRDDDNGADSGSAYVFARDETGWNQQAKLTAIDGAAGDWFGESASVDGDTAIVGAFGDDDNGTDSGSAYIFVRNGTTWSQQAKLTPNDGAANDYFGISVAVHGDIAIIGAYGDDGYGTYSGSAYVFARAGTTWSQQAKLTPADTEDSGYFGYRVATDGDYAVVGAPLQNTGVYGSGAAYIFVRDGTTWSQQAKLAAGDAGTYDFFGNSVSISGVDVVVGAPFDDVNGSSSGSVYVFARNGITWMQEVKLNASDGAAGDDFGRSAAIDGDLIIVGAWGDGDNGAASGSAYIFTRNGAAWREQAKFTPSDGAANDQFGWSTAIDGSTAIVGAPRDDDNGEDSGSAWPTFLMPIRRIRLV
jgi:hypothetical protein